jgi:hypothetical protein
MTSTAPTTGTDTVPSGQSTRRANAPIPRATRIAAVVATSIAFGLYSIHLGQDVNWDQRNYHLYTAYALLHGRLDYDLVPAGLQTFLPPFYNLPFYWLARDAPPMLAGFALAALQGLNAVLAFMLAETVVPRGTSHRHALAAIAATLGAWSPAAMSELGTSFGDNVVSLFVVGGILALVRRDDGWERPAPLVLSGVLSGMAAGFKYTNAVYSLALLAAVGCLIALRRIPRASIAALVGGMVLGVGLVDGAWAWRLWRTYGNPVFPFFNRLFGSPYWTDTNFTDARWLPSSAWDGLAYPFYFVRTQARTMEMPFRDPRWAILTILGLVYGAQRVCRRPDGDPPTDPRGTARTVVTLFGIGAFLLWAFAFGYHRYLVPLELLSGVLVLIAARAVCPTERARLVAVVLVALCILGSVQVPSWGRAPWGRTWFGVHVDGRVPPRSLVIVSSTAPLSYVIPFLPHRARFVRLDPRVGPALARDIEKTVHAHPGPLRLLFKGAVSDLDRTMLRRHGLEATERCLRVQSRLDADLFVCHVQRVAM